MAQAFVGTALPLDQAGLDASLDLLGIKAAELWTVIQVETGGKGFMPNRKPFILFERHIFSKQTGGRFDAAYPDISNPSAGGYGEGGDHQYQRLAVALNLDRGAALRSTSWGLGQIMGFNAAAAGFADAEAMVAAMMASEAAQLLGMVRFLSSSGLGASLRAHNWPQFARGYNGPEYAKNSYDTRLSANYQRLSLGALPDLSIRAAQLYLTYLGYFPGTVDGVLGKLTRAALNDFQTAHKLPLGDTVGDAELAAMQAALAQLPH